MVEYVFGEYRKNEDCNNREPIEFVPSEATVTELLFKTSTQLIAAAKQRKLAPESAVNPLDPYFVCTICQHVVEDPSECAECNDLCCSACLNRWRQRKNTCPSC